MKSIIFIDLEDLAIAIKTYLSINMIDSTIAYKYDDIVFNQYDIAITSEDRAKDIMIKQLVLTYDRTLTGCTDMRGYLLRPFTSSELLKKIKEMMNAC